MLINSQLTDNLRKAAPALLLFMVRHRPEHATSGRFEQIKEQRLRTDSNQINGRPRSSTPSPRM